MVTHSIRVASKLHVPQLQPCPVGVELGGAYKREVHPQAPVDSWAVNADEDAIGDWGPRGVLGAAVKANLRKVMIVLSVLAERSQTKCNVSYEYPLIKKVIIKSYLICLTLQNYITAGSPFWKLIGTHTEKLPPKSTSSKSDISLHCKMFCAQPILPCLCERINNDTNHILIPWLFIWYNTWLYGIINGSLTQWQINEDLSFQSLFLNMH